MEKEAKQVCVCASREVFGDRYVQERMETGTVVWPPKLAQYFFLHFHPSSFSVLVLDGCNLERNRLSLVLIRFQTPRLGTSGKSAVGALVSDLETTTMSGLRGSSSRH